MIIDQLENAEKYFSSHPGFKEGFGFLRRAVECVPEDGKYEIDGRDVYAIVSPCEGKGAQGAKLEVHEAYIDIQFCPTGRDVIGWSSLSKCVRPEGEYDSEKDVRFFEDEFEKSVDLEGETFCVFYPDDAHAPAAGIGNCKKIVIKVRI